MKLGQARKLPTAAAVEVLVVGTERGIEARVIPARGERLETMEVTPLKGQSPIGLLKSVARLPSALGRATALVREFAPDLVLGVGGYASGPLLLAASAKSSGPSSAGARGREKLRACECNPRGVEI